VLQLDDEQMQLLKANARPIHPGARDAFLRRVASLLKDRPFTTMDLRKAIATAQHEALGITQPGSWWE
jgi:hypothetical protein